MKAIVHSRYGSPDVLELEEVQEPQLADDLALVRVRAVSINPADWYGVTAPLAIRPTTGIFKPRSDRTGIDFAGTVEAVGKDVTHVQPGDDVFGARSGALAEYVTVRDAVVPKPANVSFEEAAAVPVAAITALQALRDKGRLQPGQRVLVNGASGGVGTFAVQIAKTMGLHVTGVCSGRNVARVRALGADRVIDYTREDFTSDGSRYDVVLDLVGNRDLLDVRRVLKPGGRHVLIGGGGPNDGRWFGPFAMVLRGLAIDPFVDQEFSMLLARIDAGDLEHLAGLMRKGTVVPVIDRRYTLDQVPAAIDYLERGRARGKVIITVAAD